MDCTAMMHESVWFNRLQFEEAETKYQLHLAGCLTPAGEKAQGGASDLVGAIAKARENIQQSLESANSASQTSSLSGSQVENLAKENKNLRALVEQLSASVQSLTLRVDKLEGKSQPTPASSAKPAAPTAAEDDEDDDDDVDLFGSDDEEEAAAAEKLKAERIKAYEDRKANKKTVVAKSSLLLDVKPWDDETDMNEVERLVRTIEMDGLIWAQKSKFVPVGYGIKKLQIGCVVEDAKVSTDDLEEKITAFEDLVQSMDIAAFNKI